MLREVRKLSQLTKVCSLCWGGAPASKPRHDIQLYEVIRHPGAGAEFYPVADFVAEGVEGICGAESVAGALRVLATGNVTAVSIGFDCGLKSHA